MVSPTPSAGQRSVKTTTTTMSAGLKDRPLSPEHTVEEESGQPSRPVRSKGDKTTRDRQRHQQQSGKVSRTPSPFQKLADFFKPKTNKQMAAAR